MRGDLVALPLKEFELLELLHARTPGGCSPATCSSTGSGARTTSATPRRSTSTSSGCAPRSRTTRRTRRASSPSAASATGTRAADLQRPSASGAAECGSRSSSIDGRCRRADSLASSCWSVSRPRRGRGRARRRRRCSAVDGRGAGGGARGGTAVGAPRAPARRRGRCRGASRRTGCRLGGVMVPPPTAAVGVVERRCGCSPKRIGASGTGGAVAASGGSCGSVTLGACRGRACPSCRRTSCHLRQCLLRSPRARAATRDLADSNFATTTPSRSMTNVPRFAQPSCSLNTPYALATSPCGQKSDEHREREALLLGPLRLRVAGVAADREHRRVGALEHRRVVADLAELALAHTGEGERDRRRAPPAACPGSRPGSRRCRPGP